MKPYLEHIAFPTDSSWVLFDRRLDHIPFEWHYNTEYELTLTLNSRGQRFIGDNISFYEDGDLVLIGPKVPHTWHSSGDIDPARSHQAIVLWFTEKFIKGIIEPHVELRPVQTLLDASARAVTFSRRTRLRAREIICSMLHQAPATRLVSLLQVLLLLADDSRASCLTSDAGGNAALPAASEERIGRVISHLHAHYRDEIAIPKLMRIAALSRSSLHRLFRQQTSMTIGEYVTQLRVGNACALLMNSEKAISLISDEVGYRSLANFNRHFRAEKGTTPREFRAAFSR
jgi:AraC-like DNA-binding protein